MKNPNFRANHKRKEQTLNYKADSHKQFCKRCILYNKGCPATGKKVIVDRDCSL